MSSFNNRDELQQEIQQTQEYKLKYQPFSSIINPGFWQLLTNIKLNKLKLSKEPLPITGFYSCGLSDKLPCLASLDQNAFSSETTYIDNDKNSCILFGKVICTNIIQEFLDYDKKKLLNDSGQEIWNAITNGLALFEPDKYLSKFGLLVYADLKKYKFFYWFYFPSINYTENVYYLPFDDSDLNSSSKSIAEEFSREDLLSLQTEYDKYQNTAVSNKNFFVIINDNETSNENKNLKIITLSHYKQLVSKNPNKLNSSSNTYFAYKDPSGSRLHPGWPLRNYICLLVVEFKLNEFNIVRIRSGPKSQDYNTNIHHSLLLRINLSITKEYQIKNIDGVPTSICPPISGWERNESQQLAPRRVCLASLLDPKKLADDALNLNLRLMKWRLLPSLDLEKISATKCLLLGSGTLGCHIARCLLAWGIKTITFVDNAKLSYSNPVRQTLYTFEDCITNSKDNSSSEGPYKAPIALERLKKIHPLVNGEAHVLSIPMPGHHIPDLMYEKTREDVEKLEQLIETHDAIFLLMDTRESRWLPTVISITKQKLVINAAIGFETFLVQRYGIRKLSSFKQRYAPNSSSVEQVQPELHLDAGPSSRPDEISGLPSDKLGCYFCNDIVAPGDSTQDRTLDQQCTVSRPGVSMIVSALAAELLVSVITSRRGSYTPAPINFDDDDYEASDLGVVPHCIRGNLSRFEIYKPTSPAFSKCSACSNAVINEYKERGFEFLIRVFNDSSHLEDIAGLKDFQGVDENTVWAIDTEDEEEED